MSCERLLQVRMVMPMGSFATPPIFLLTPSSARNFRSVGGNLSSTSAKYLYGLNTQLAPNVHICVPEIILSPSCVNRPLSFCSTRVLTTTQSTDAAQQIPRLRLVVTSRYNSGVSQDGLDTPNICPSSESKHHISAACLRLHSNQWDCGHMRRSCTTQPKCASIQA